MAAAFDDEDLSVSLPPVDRDRHRERSNGSNNSPNPNQSAMAMPPPSRPIGKGPDPSRQSPATMRDMQRLDQYHTVKVLGEGSFGKVKLAIHQPSGRQVALKIISRRKLLSRDMMGRVEREIQYLQLLRHPHIIKLYASPLLRLTIRGRRLTLSLLGTPSFQPKPISLWYWNMQSENCSITW
jgi:carbon catabolite-derepressing protein kinase